MLTFFEKEVNGYFFVFPIVSCRPKTWLHVSWRVTLVLPLVNTFFLRLSFPPPANRAEVTYSVWTGSVAWLGPSDCTEYNLSQAFRWWSVAQSQRAGRCSSLFSAHISSRRPHNLNSWNSFLRRRLVEDIWLALDCMSWPVTLVALFPALDNRGCTVSHAKIGKFSHACNYFFFQQLLMPLLHYLRLFLLLIVVVLSPSLNFHVRPIS